jgi:hypothetical protein
MLHQLLHLLLPRSNNVEFAPWSKWDEEHWAVNGV